MENTNTGYLGAQGTCICEPRLPQGDRLELSLKSFGKSGSRELALNKNLAQSKLPVTSF